MKKLSFLEIEKIFGGKQLEIVQKYGRKCAITDFAILLGGYVSPIFCTRGGTDDRDRTGWWWTLTPYDNRVFVIAEDGSRSTDHVDTRITGARPCISYSSISSDCTNETVAIGGIKEVEYGEYPQMVVSENEARKLEQAFLNGTITLSGKSYTTDSVPTDKRDVSFKAMTHKEYEYHGKKYIRFVADSRGAEKKLSDGRKIIAGNVYWISVDPIKWQVEEKADIALSKKILFSGVQFQNKREYQGNFSITNINYFLEQIFAKEISTKTSREEELISRLTLKRIERKKVKD